MKSVMHACAIAGMLAFASPVTAGDLSGTYVSDITTDSNWYFKRRYRNLELTFRQDGNWIVAGESKYDTRVSGFRDGDVVHYFVEPGKLSDEAEAYGKWTVNSGNLKGSWKVDGSYAANGKWDLSPGKCKPKKCGLPPSATAALMSELVVKIDDGNPQRFYDVIGPLVTVDPYQGEDLPMKRLKLKSISEELGWLKEYNLDGNKAVDAAEMCHALLVKLIEFRTGKSLTPGALQFVPANGETTTVCLPRSQRQSVNAGLLAVQSGDSGNAQALHALYQLFPQYQDRGDSEDRDGGGDGGGGGGEGGGGGGGM